MSGSVLFIVDNASQLPSARTLATSLARACGGEPVGFILTSRNPISRQQAEEMGAAAAVTLNSIEKILRHPAVLSATALVAFLTGSTLHRFVQQLHRVVADSNTSRRPIVVTGYNGLVYEKHIEGVLWRSGCDVICVNSPQDYATFKTLFDTLDIDSSALCTSGVIPAQFTRSDYPAGSSETVKQLVFATQAIVPVRKQERIYLLHSLCRYAADHPGQKVVVKPRSRPGELTFHREEYPYEPLLREVERPVPDNFAIDYGPLGEFLGPGSLVVSVSSTAVIESISKGTPAAILTDLGIKESLGNHFFLGSGLLRSTRQLSTGDFPVINPDWMVANGFSPRSSIQAVADRVLALEQQQAEAGTALPFATPIYDGMRAPYVQEQFEGPDLARGRPRSRLTRTLLRLIGRRDAR